MNLWYIPKPCPTSDIFTTSYDVTVKVTLTGDVRVSEEVFTIQEYCTERLSYATDKELPHVAPFLAFRKRDSKTR